MLSFGHQRSHQGWKHAQILCASAIARDSPRLKTKCAVAFQELLFLHLGKIFSSTTLEWGNCHSSVTNNTKSTVFVFQRCNFCTDFQSGSKFHVHGGHKMIFLQQHERLTVDLLRPELVRVRGATRQRMYEFVHIHNLQETTIKMCYSIQEICHDCDISCHLLTAQLKQKRVKTCLQTQL